MFEPFFCGGESGRWKSLQILKWQNKASNVLYKVPTQNQIAVGCCWESELGGLVSTYEFPYIRTKRDERYHHFEWNWAHLDGYSLALLSPEYRTYFSLKLRVPIGSGKSLLGNLYWLHPFCLINVNFMWLVYVKELKRQATMSQWPPRIDVEIWNLGQGKFYMWKFKFIGLLQEKNKLWNGKFPQCGCLG